MGLVLAQHLCFRETKPKVICYKDKLHETTLKIASNTGMVSDLKISQKHENVRAIR